MQKTYTADNRKSFSIDELVKILASSKGVDESEAAKMILGDELLDKWIERHGNTEEHASQ